DPPVAKPMTVDAVEDVARVAALPGSDVDGDALTFRILTQPRLGSARLTDAATGAWHFQPSPDANGDDAFTFDVTDGRTVAQGTVKLRVAAVNDAPVAAELVLATREDTAVEGDVLGSDVDHDTLRWSVDPGSRARIDAAGHLRFEPARDAYGAMSFFVTVSDGALSSRAKVTVNVAPVNDAPVAKAGALATDEDV